MDTVITTLVAGTPPASADGRAPTGARHADAPHAFGSVLDGAIDAASTDRPGTAVSAPNRRTRTASGAGGPLARPVSKPPVVQDTKSQAPVAQPQAVPASPAQAEAVPVVAAPASPAQAPAASAFHGQTQAEPASAAPASPAQAPAADAQTSAALTPAGQEQAANPVLKVTGPTGKFVPIGSAMPTARAKALVRLAITLAPQAQEQLANVPTAAASDKTKAQPDTACVVFAPDESPAQLMPALVEAVCPESGDGAPKSSGMAVIPEPGPATADGNIANLIGTTASTPIATATVPNAVEATPNATATIPRAPLPSSSASLASPVWGGAADAMPAAGWLASPVRAGLFAPNPQGSAAAAVPVRVADRIRPASLASSLFDTAATVEASTLAGTGLSPVAKDPQSTPVASGDVAAFVRATLARYIASAGLVNDTSGVAPRSGTGRAAGLSLPVVSDSGSPSPQDVADPLQSLAVTAANAARMPFQLVQADIEAPAAWARNELSKATQVVGDLGSVERLAKFGAGLGENRPAPGNQQNASRDAGGGAAAMMFGTGPGLSSSGQTAALDGAAFAAATIRAEGASADPTTEAGSLTHSIVRVVKLQATAGGGEIQLRLRPEHLGELSVSVKVESGVVSAVLRSDSPEVRAWIQQHQQDLRSGLKEQGLLLDQLTVDPEGRREQQRQAQPDDSERTQTTRRQGAPGRFEALI